MDIERKRSSEREDTRNKEQIARNKKQKQESKNKNQETNWQPATGNRQLKQ